MTFSSSNSGPGWRRLRWLLPAVFTLLVALSACVPALLSPPRAEQTPFAPPTAEPVSLPAPTPTGSAVAAAAVNPGSGLARPTLTLWVDRSSRRYEQALNQIIADFTASQNIHVELVTVNPALLPDLVVTAATSPTYPLPDVLLMSLEFVVGWAEEGILDVGAADAIIQELGPETFDPDALDLARVDGRVAAIPSDGWQQLLLYRKDWFAEKGLDPPTDFEAMVSAASVISDRTSLIYSFNMPTESSLQATTRAFEQMAIANGCQLIDDNGELLLLEPVCRDALEFYRYLCNTFCPPGVQTEVSALNAYLSGRAGFILTTPWALPAVAGLDDNYHPTCPDCDRNRYLARNTGVVTTIRGRGEAASAENLGTISYLGITTVADEETAAAFARFWFEEGYLAWLAVEPARKVPMRLGTAEEPTRFLDAWYDLPLAGSDDSIADIFGDDVAQTLAADLVNRNRWGYTQGQGALIGDIFEELTLSILLQELLSGYYDSDRAAIEGYKRLVDLLPNYEYYFDPEPTPES